MENPKLALLDKKATWKDRVLSFIGNAITPLGNWLENKADRKLEAAVKEKMNPLHQFAMNKRHMEELEDRKKELGEKHGYIIKEQTIQAPDQVRKKEDEGKAKVTPK